MGLRVKPKHHFISSLFLMILLYSNNYIQSQISFNFILGVTFGTGLDFDHIIWAIIYDRSEISKVLSPISINKIWKYLNKGSLLVKMGNTKRERIVNYYILHIFSAISLSVVSYILLPQFYSTVLYSFFLHLTLDFIFNILVKNFGYY